MGKISTPDPNVFPATAELVIIGGGIVGAATAFYASQAGLDAILVEKRESLAALTTPASAEAVRAQFDDPENLTMMKASLEVFERFAEVIGIPDYRIDFHQQGYLFVTTAETGPQMLQQRVERQHNWGLDDVEYLDGDEARRRFPYLAPTVTAGTFRQRDGWLSTHETTYGFAKGSSARIYLQTEATGFKMEGGRITGVETTRGMIHCPTVVIAAGPYAPQIAAWAGVELPTVIKRRQKAVVHSALIPEDAPMTIDLDQGPYWRPEAKGGLLGWAEVSEEPPASPQDHVAADWDFPALALEGCARIAPFWDRVAETLRQEDVHASAGHYTITPDHKPILGPAGEVEGLYLNAAYSGHGVMAAPDGSRQVVDMILGRIALEENPFRLERFEEIVALSAEQMII